MVGRRAAIALVVLSLAVSSCVWEKQVWSVERSGLGSRAIIDWSADGRYLLYGDWIDDAESIHFYLRDMTTDAEIEDFGVGTLGLWGWSISADGRYIAYSIDDGELANGIPVRNVYLRDRQTSTDTLVSQEIGGQPGDGNSLFPEISADGSIVAFQSDDDDLVTDTVGSARRFQVFRYRVSTGAIDLVSRTPTGNPGGGASRWPAVSADGSQIAFESSASDLVTGDTNGAQDVFSMGPGGAITRRSQASNGAKANGSSREARMSADGTTVSFQSNATNLVVGGTTGWNVYTSNGLGQIERVNIDEGGTPVVASSEFELLNLDISSDGSLVMFGRAFLGAESKVWLRDRQTESTQIASTDAGGSIRPGAWDGQLTDDGRSVLITTRSDVAPDQFVDDAFLRHAQNPVISSVTPSSVGAGSTSVTFEGVGFYPGTKLRAIGRPDVTLSDVVIVDRGTITATVVVASGTPAGSVSISATVPKSPTFGPGVGGVGVCTCFDVTS